MPEPTMSMTVDPADDLPRTLKRERAAREKAAREQDLASAREPSFSPRERDREPEPKIFKPSAIGAYPDRGSDLVAANVRAIDVPFGRLVVFFMKAAVAAIPALFLLGAVIVGAGTVLKSVAPDYRVVAVTFHLPWMGGAVPPAKAAEPAKAPAQPTVVPAPAKK